MRLAITKTGFYNADIYCTDTRSAKRILREENITLLAIDYYLVGKGSGEDLIDWAASNFNLPGCVVIIERDRDLRKVLASALYRAGLSSKDDINFFH